MPDTQGGRITYGTYPGPSCTGCRCLILYAGLDGKRLGCMVFGLNQFAEPCPARQESEEKNK